MADLTLLLPALERFGGQALGRDAAKALGRADAGHAGSGRRAQLQRQVRLPAGRWPIAALSRQSEVGDAEGWAWLRAEPAWLQPDINGVRLMAYGPALEPTEADVAALLPTLQPLFGDAGFALDAPTPARWYVRAPAGTRLPTFPDPADVVGDDLFEFDDREDSAEARRWRLLSSESQILLHNLPWNQQRAAHGKAPINALWFWGGGVLPMPGAAIVSSHTAIHSDDPTLQALAASVGVANPLDEAMSPAHAAGSVLVDLAHDTDLRRIEEAWLQPAIDALRNGALHRLTLDAEDGRCWHFTRGQRWRFWRQPRLRLSQ
ncbi:MAG: phosphoglycerate mutase [Pseudoxanthomonas suwonensis]|nr:phosphoglycerate mutase [Pseudoxanthomonas suwonensis]